MAYPVIGNPGMHGAVAGIIGGVTGGMTGIWSGAIMPIGGAPAPKELQDGGAPQ